MSRGLLSKVEILALRLIDKNETDAWYTTRCGWIEKFKDVWASLEHDAPSQSSSSKSRHSPRCELSSDSTKVSRFLLFKDAPDTVVSQASCNRPYGHHTDSKEKVDNHSDAEPWSHSQQMRILTHCLVRSVDGTQVSEKTVKIRHGLPGSKSKHKFCRLVGCFSSKEQGKFVAATSHSKAYCGSEVAAHLQMRGSQGDLHHWIDSVEQNVVRIIHSPRLLTPFQRTKEMCDKLCENAEVIESDSHDTRNVVSVLCQSFGGIIVNKKDQRMRPNSTSKWSLAKPSKKLKKFESPKYPNEVLDQTEKIQREHGI